MTAGARFMFNLSLASVMFFGVLVVAQPVAAAGDTDSKLKLDANGGPQYDNLDIGTFRLSRKSSMWVVFNEREGSTPSCYAQVTITDSRHRAPWDHVYTYPDNYPQYSAAFVLHAGHHHVSLYSNCGYWSIGIWQQKHMRT